MFGECRRIWSLYCWYQEFSRCFSVVVTLTVSLIRYVIFLLIITYNLHIGMCIFVVVENMPVEWKYSCCLETIFCILRGHCLNVGMLEDTSHLELSDNVSRVIAKPLFKCLVVECRKWLQERDAQWLEFVRSVWWDIQDWHTVSSC